MKNVTEAVFESIKKVKENLPRMAVDAINGKPSSEGHEFEHDDGSKIGFVMYVVPVELEAEIDAVITARAGNPEHYFELEEYE